MSNDEIRAVRGLEAWRRQTGNDKFQVIFDGMVFENAWWVDSKNCPGEAHADPSNNPWRIVRRATEAEMNALGNPTSCKDPTAETP